jgi:hypothetical protein
MRDRQTRTRTRIQRLMLPVGTAYILFSSGPIQKNITIQHNTIQLFVSLFIVFLLSQSTFNSTQDYDL